MKKYFFVLFIGCALSQADALTDAIIESDVKKVQECIQNGGKVEIINLEIAQHIMEMRGEQRTHNSPLDCSVPGTAWNKVGMIVGASGIPLLMNEIRLFTPFGFLRFRHRYCFIVRAVTLGLIGLCIGNGLAVYHKKIKFLDQKHKEAIFIYQLMREAIKT